MSSEVETSLTILRGSPAPSQSNAIQRDDQLHFFDARSVFELFFTRNRIQHVCAGLVVNQFPTAVISGEAWNLSGTMLGDSAREITGHAKVEQAVMLICDDVDSEVIVLCHRKYLEIPRLRSE
jgi:hypothetical protein